MSTEKSDQPDPVDGMLANAFEQALAGSDLVGSENDVFIERVMARIARQQRQRTLLMALFGLLALAIGLFSVLPLLEFIPSLLANLSSFAATSGESQFSGPVIIAAIAIAAAGAWLLLEEATS